MAGLLRYGCFTFLCFHLVSLDTATLFVNLEIDSPTTFFFWMKMRQN